MREAWFAIALLSVALFAASCGSDLDGYEPELDEAAESLMASCSGSVTPANLEFDSTVEGPYRASIRQDLKVLSCLNLRAKSNTQLQLMGVNEMSGATLTAWLAARVKIVVGETYDASSEMEFLAWNYSPQTTYYADFNQFADASTVMSNIGVAVYVKAKRDEAFYALPVNGTSRPVKTGRVGITQIGPALMAVTNRVTGLPADALVNSLIRLGTEFHEGRHGDSNSSSLGFLHAICPAGYRSLTGEAACEKYSNGPYSLHAQMLSLFLEQACANCTAGAREKLRTLQADRASRVLGNATWVDARPEQTL